MKEFLKHNITKIIILFLIIQPIIDCLTAISLNVFHLEITVGIITRFSFLLFLIIYNELLDKGSSKTRSYLAIITIYIFLFIGNILFTKDSSCLFYELKNLARYLYFPLLLINLYAIDQKHKIRISKKTLVGIFTIYLGLILIPMVTHTDFIGYFEGKVGTIGWFHSTNEISAILSGLFPLVFISSRNRFQNILFLIATGIVFFSLGSKITIVAFGITILFYFVKWFLKSNHKKTIAVSLVPIGLFIAALGVFFIPKTSFYKNIQIHLEFLQVENITDILKDEKLFDHFIFSSRLTFLKNTHSSYKSSNLSSKILGIGFIENYATEQISLKTIEMDFFDIFYRLGLSGTILYFLPIIDILHQKKTKKQGSQKLALALFLFTSFLAGHVLTSPAVSIYLAILILGFIEEENHANSDYHSEL